MKPRVLLVHYTYSKQALKSLLSLFNYVKHGENRPKYHGVRIPPSNLQDGFDDAARTFAGGLADRLGA